MAVTKQKPCINDTVLELAKEAAIGDVFIYSGNEYQWTPRSESWQGIMLTKTERGFELIDKNGRSHGIVNLGEPYHNIDPHPSCTACGKDYVFQNQVSCITAVCCDQELYVGNCAEKGWSVDWCELPPRLTKPAPPVVFIRQLEDSTSEVTQLEYSIRHTGDTGGGPLVNFTYELVINGTIVEGPFTLSADKLPFKGIMNVSEWNKFYGVRATVENELLESDKASYAIEILQPIVPPLIEWEAGNWGGTRQNDIRVTIDPTDVSPYELTGIEYVYHDGVTADKTGVLTTPNAEGLYQFTVTDPYPSAEFTITARNLAQGVQSDWAQAEGVVPPVVPDRPTLRINSFEQVGTTITAHANFNWAASEVGTGGAPITSVSVSYREKGTGNEIVVPMGEFKPSIPFDMTGLKPNTTYTYWSTVSNEAGPSQTFITDFTTPALQLSFDEMVLTGQAVTTAVTNLPAPQARNVINQQAAQSLTISRTEVVDNPFAAFAQDVPNAVKHYVTGYLDIEPSDFGTAVCLTYKANPVLQAAVDASVTESEAWCRVLNTSNNNINVQFAATAAQFAGNNIGAIFFVLDSNTGEPTHPRGYNNNNSGLTLSGHSVGNTNAVYIFDFTEVQIRVAQ